MARHAKLIQLTEYELAMIRVALLSKVKKGKANRLEYQDLYYKVVKIGCPTNGAILRRKPKVSP